MLERCGTLIGMEVRARESKRGVGLFRADSFPVRETDVRGPCRVEFGS